MPKKAYDLSKFFTQIEISTRPNKNFCEYIKSHDLNNHDIIKKASDKSLSFVENKEDNTVMIYDEKTLGKATCHIDLNKKVIVYQGYD